MTDEKTKTKSGIKLIGLKVIPHKSEAGLANAVKNNEHWDATERSNFEKKTQKNFVCISDVCPKNISRRNFF